MVSGRDRLARGRWTVEWREPIGDGLGPEPFMLCSETVSSAAAVRACVARAAPVALLGEFRLIPPMGDCIYTELHRVLAWDGGDPVCLRRVHSPWRTEVRRRTGARRFREELRVSIDRALNAGAIDDAGAVLVIEVGRTVTEAGLSVGFRAPFPGA